MLRVGIIGSGNIARKRHAPGWLNVAGKARVTAVSDIDLDAAAELADILCAEGEKPAIYEDFKKLIREADIDAVDICLPHHLHSEAILAAVAAGKHILCEKPMCITLKEADQIVEAVDKAGVVYMSAHNELFFPPIAAAKTFIDRGTLGKPYIIRSHEFPTQYRAAEIPGRSAPATMMTGWRASRETMGGGMLIDKGYHPTYILLYLAGSEPVAVTAMTNTYVADMEGEDTALVMVKFANGAIGQIFTGEAFVFPANDAKFHIIGERGEIYGNRWDVFAKPRGFAEPAHTVFTEDPNFGVMDMEIMHFVDSIETGQRPIQDHHDGRRVLEVIQAAYQSLETGRTIDLPLAR
ncbi:MAG TPA: Gfo/Idh/MocA family oxidoreductase [Thermomicrobiales bacterium]|nr:Gfo/Idh/MocA family oxidoreductase [Thermomicrobiales bacterium]